LSLWVPRPLTAADFEPDDASPNGYIREVNIQAVLRELIPREETFAIEIEPASGRREGKELAFRFSAESRELHYLRDEQDNVVGNLWDDFVGVATGVDESRVAIVEPTDTRYIVIDGHRVRFKSLSMRIDVKKHTISITVDLAKDAFAYENAVTGETRTVPLPASVLEFTR